MVFRMRACKWVPCWWPLGPFETFLAWAGPGAQLHLALGSSRASPGCAVNPDLVHCICKAITAVRTNVANLSDAAMWKIKRARFARNRQKSVRSLRDSVKGPAESKRALSLPETFTTKIRWVSGCVCDTPLSCFCDTPASSPLGPYPVDGAHWNCQFLSNWDGKFRVLSALGITLIMTT